ncbi:hypothetical protein GW17_00017338 [Ensete ventricosum]|nr:hypothetical protein GW17_00017338 [Ensete ventricosum]
MLLSITILSIANIIEEEEATIIDEAELSNQWKEKTAGGKCRKDLVSSLQILGDYESLLVPPLSVTSVANQAAAKAMMFVSGLTGGSGYLENEHTVRFVVKLLSPPVPVDYAEGESHLISHGPMLNVVLTGISSVDCVQIFSFHGLVGLDFEAGFENLSMTSYH